MISHYDNVKYFTELSILFDVCIQDQSKFKTYQLNSLLLFLHLHIFALHKQIHSNKQENDLCCTYSIQKPGLFQM